MNKLEGYIGVAKEDVSMMKWLGYTVCGGRDVDFVPKSSFPFDSFKTMPALELLLEELRERGNNYVEKIRRGGENESRKQGKVYKLNQGHTKR